MKKIVILLAAIIVFSFTACENETPAPEHQHKYGSPVVLTEAGLFSDGNAYVECTDPSCPDEDKGYKEVVIPADGTTSELIYYFENYADNLKKSENGVVLGLITDEDSTYGASSWLGQKDKLTTYEEEPITIGFTLDLNAMNINDFTEFSLAHGTSSEADGAWAFGYITENIAAIMKTGDDTYKVAQVNNVFFSEEEDRTLINASENFSEISDEDGILKCAFTVTHNGSDLAVSFSVNGEEAVIFSINNSSAIANCEGIGYLWNTIASTSDVVMSNLIRN